MNDREYAEWIELQRQCIRFIIAPDRTGYRASAIELLHPHDFSDGSHGSYGAMFVAVRELHRLHGAHWEQSQIAVLMSTYGISDAEPQLRSIEASGVPPMILANARVLVSQMIAMRQRRQIADAVTSASLRASDIGVSDPHQMAADIVARFDQILDAGTARWPVYERAEDIKAIARDDWALHRLLVPGEVGMVTAGGGAGKSTLLRGWAYAAVNGLDPWTGSTGGRESRAVVFDFETQPWNVKASSIAIRRNLADWIGVHIKDIAEPVVMSHRSRVNLRDARDLAEMKRIIRDHRPRFVCMGPLKNLYSMGDKESYENAALETMDILMQLMNEFDCAIAIEAHGTKSDRGGTSGSQRWEDWPDFSISLDVLERGDCMGPEMSHFLSWFDDPRRLQSDKLVKVTRRRYNRNEESIIPPAIAREAGNGLPWKGIFPKW